MFEAETEHILSHVKHAQWLKSELRVRWSDVRGVDIVTVSTVAFIAQT